MVNQLWNFQVWDMLGKQKFCQFDVAYTVISKLTNDFCILEKFAKKKDIQMRKDLKEFKAEGNDFLALCFAQNSEISCHYEKEIRFFPMRALMHEDHDLVFDQN
jgi:hypothetical protein